MPTAPATAADFATFPVLALAWAMGWVNLSQGWTLQLDDDATHELMSIVRPFAPKHAEASFVIIPVPEGVLMAGEADGWRQEIAFPSLRACLLSIYALTADQLSTVDLKASSAAGWTPVG